MSAHDHLLPRIAELAAQGLTNAQIGNHVGLSTNQVWRLRNPERYRASTRKTNAKRAAAKREWERDPANRVKCPKCGDPTSATPSPSAPALCRVCETARRRGDKEARREVIAAMWGEGATAREIATRLGSTANSIGVAVCVMRREGWDMSIRRPATQRMMRERWGTDRAV